MRWILKIVTRGHNLDTIKVDWQDGRQYAGILRVNGFSCYLNTPYSRVVNLARDQCLTPSRSGKKISAQILCVVPVRCTSGNEPLREWLGVYFGLVEVNRFDRTFPGVTQLCALAQFALTGFGRQKYKQQRSFQLSGKLLQEIVQTPTGTDGVRIVRNDQGVPSPAWLPHSPGNSHN